MNDTERLELIIETALKHGWERLGNSRLWKVGTDHEKPITVFRATEYGPESYFSAEEMIYGDNLSLLKAACGEEDLEVGDRFTWRGAPIYLPSWWWVAQESVILPDNERLAFIMKHLRKESEG